MEYFPIESGQVTQDQVNGLIASAMQGAPMVGNSTYTGSGTTLAATTATMTAPSDGYAVMFLDSIVDTRNIPDVKATASLGVPTMVPPSVPPAGLSKMAYLRMLKGQSSTFTSTVTNGVNSQMFSFIRVFFIPSPNTWA